MEDEGFKPGENMMRISEPAINVSRPAKVMEHSFVAPGGYTELIVLIRKWLSDNGHDPKDWHFEISADVFGPANHYTVSFRSETRE